MFPTIEQRALETQRTGEGDIALLVGLDDEAVRACITILGEAVNVVPTCESAAAADLLAVLRPRLAVASQSLNTSERAQLAAVAKSYQTRLIWVTTDLDILAFERLVRPVAAVAFFVSHYKWIPEPRTCTTSSEEASWSNDER